MEITRVDTKCIVCQANSSKTVESEVHEFKDKEKLVVVLNKSVKLNMVWNGKMYEGKMAGIDFISEGPKVTKTKIGR
jgi:RecJ-like exonuclease